LVLQVQENLETFYSRVMEDVIENEALSRVIWLSITTGTGVRSVLYASDSLIWHTSAFVKLTRLLLNSSDKEMLQKGYYFLFFYLNFSYNESS
jgi:hypothetical protein